MTWRVALPKSKGARSTTMGKNWELLAIRDLLAAGWGLHGFIVRGAAYA